MRLLFITFLPLAMAIEPYFASVANAVLATKDGSRFASSNVPALLQLEQQVKRVMAADPSKDLNVSEVREWSDIQILRILLLAVMGNFTVGDKGPMECSLQIDADTGYIVPESPGTTPSVALKIILAILVVIQLRYWYQEEYKPPPPPH
jgi:hypothetical protein